MSKQLKLLTLKEVAEILKVSTRTVRRYIKDGHIEAHRLEGSFRITQTELNSFIESRTVKGE